MKAQIVSLRCVLKNRLGKVLSSSYCQDVLTTSPGEGPLRGLAEALADLKQGEVRKISLNAKEAYGFYDPGLVLVCQRDELRQAGRLKVGQPLEVQEEGAEPRTYRVVEIHPCHIVLDANHPLAGQDLEFEIQALAAREATAEEIEGANTAPEVPPVRPRYIN